MAKQHLSEELVEAIEATARGVGVEVASQLSKALAGPRSVVVAPSDTARFSRVVVRPDGVPLAVGHVDRLRVTFTNRGAASVFLHSHGDTYPIIEGVELAAAETRTFDTRDEIWASCTVAAASVRVDVVVEAVFPA
jgi:hypothetical protein